MGLVEMTIEALQNENAGIDDASDEFITLVAEKCHGCNVSLSDLLFCLEQRYGDASEFSDLVGDVYAELEYDSTQKENVEGSSALLNTPTIFDKVENWLPQILTSGADNFIDIRQKDTFLVSALTVLSSLLTNITGRYGDERVHPTLFALIIAPAASGKSAMRYAIQLAQPVHDSIKEQCALERKDYLQRKRDYERACRTNKTSDVGDPPEEPTSRLHFIPGNSSKASIIKQLAANGGKGLVPETEADSLTQNFGSEWGDFSDLIRKCFHHETISSARKTDNEILEVNRPAVSFCLTGTPNQLLALVQSAENGMMSRIVFYGFEGKTNWISPNPLNRPNTYENFEKLSRDVMELYRFYQQDEFSFELQDAHWELLDQYFSETLEKITSLYGNETSSIVKRLGLICYRIAMVLSALKNYEQNLQQTKIICSHESFMAALEMAKILLEHSILVFQKLPKSSASAFDTPVPREQFFQSLPNDFTRSHAQRIAPKYQVGSEKTVDNLLRAWVDSGRLVKPRAGSYQKTQA